MLSSLWPGGVIASVVAGTAPDMNSSWRMFFKMTVDAYPLVRT